ncbi:enoyl-CoA hydratase/isomerase family protein [Metabacillus litoralis]|uniref:enoyl-CoA hydratase/isomerase family protein n=1 Tax=Metabacillus litoralis TaxID=152268 RepID=UPI001CFE4900|nr:enoyl-CoA hydratase [Metabacillus litoralis]
MNDLLIEKEGSVLTLCLNRPESLNAFSAEMIMGLTKAFKEAQHDVNTRVVVLKGAGRSFSAGGDVKTMGDVSSAAVYEHIGYLNECIKAIKELEKPVVAAVHGFAAGAAFNLALACDLILATDESKFVMSFAQVGLISDGGGLYFLSNIIGPYRAKELFFTAKPITATEAKEYGIVNEVISPDIFDNKVKDYASQLAQEPVKALGMMKKIINSQGSLEEILEAERMTQTFMVNTEDYQEGVKAFKEKRKPNFKGN